MVNVVYMLSKLIKIGLLKMKNSNDKLSKT